MEACGTVSNPFLEGEKGVREGFLKEVSPDKT